jgi:hypothetical protein
LQFLSYNYTREERRQKKNKSPIRLGVEISSFALTQQKKKTPLLTTTQNGKSKAVKAKKPLRESNTQTNKMLPAMRGAQKRKKKRKKKLPDAIRDPPLLS